MPPTYPRRPTCPRWLTAEKSPAIETVRYIYAPAYLRRLIAPRDRNGTPRTRASPLASAGSASRPPALVTKIIAHKRIPFPRGISPLRSGKNPHSARNDIIKQADKKPSPLGARRGGVKHRKNSPQVTVFSQSGPAMLRDGRWQRRGNLPEGKCRKRTRASQLARGGSPPSEANRAGE